MNQERVKKCIFQLVLITPMYVRKGGGEGLEGPDWTDATKWILPGFISLQNEVENIKSKLMVATLIYNFSNFTLSKLISFGSKE